MKILVVGVGSIGRFHALNGSKFAKVGVVDIDISRANEVASESNGISYGDNLKNALNLLYTVLSTRNISNE